MKFDELELEMAVSLPSGKAATVVGLYRPWVWVKEVGDSFPPIVYQAEDLRAKKPIKVGSIVSTEYAAPSIVLAIDGDFAWIKRISPSLSNPVTVRLDRCTPAAWGEAP